MLTAIGYRVRFKVGSRVIRPQGVLFHDFTGKDWPKRSLITGNRPEGRSSRPGKSRWFGQGYEVLQTVSYEIIPGDKSTLLNINSWRYVGEIKRIEYERALEHPERYPFDLPDEPSVKAPAASYYHDFDPLPGLYQRGRYYRIQLVKGCDLTLRGFIDSGS